MHARSPLIFLTGILLAGCASKEAGLYYLGQHSQTQYAMLAEPNAAAVEDYERELLEIIQVARAENRRVPPGIHAELGYLRARQGQPEDARQHFNLERDLYPESEVFINRMLQDLEGTGPALAETAIGDQTAAAGMTGERTRVIVVLPPINQSRTGADTGILAPTLADSLVQSGYYVVPVTIVSGVLNAEGLTDTRLFRSGTMKGFWDAFGADAVLVSEILDWRKDFAGEASELVIELGAELKTTRTDEILWSGQGRVRSDLMATNLAGASIEDIIVRRDLIEWRALVSDYWNYVDTAAGRLFSSLPPGPYSGKGKGTG